MASETEKALQQAGSGADPDSSTPDSTPDKDSGGGSRGSRGADTRSWSQARRDQGGSWAPSGAPWVQVVVQLRAGGGDDRPEGPESAQEGPQGAPGASQGPDGTEEAPGAALCGVCGADSGACGCPG